ncbi:MAG: hypothetical protein AB7H90_21600 [Alphaproteobacteria bacterium]
MGQYHKTVCIEAEEGLTPYALAGAFKEGEQGFTRPSTPNAILALVCARGGNMPADCSRSPLIGRWAGKRVLVQGDYAGDDDIPNWDGPPLSSLYGMIEGDPEYQKEGETCWNDVSREAAAFIEAACNVRYFGDDWKNIVHVKPTGKHFGSCGVAEYVIDETHHDAESLAYLKRAGLQPIDVPRVPRSGDWHGIRSDEITEGHRRVIVNLDTLEYIDPVEFGQVPTLAGMVDLAPKGRRLMVSETVGGRKRKVNTLNKCAFYQEKKGTKKISYDHLVDIAGGLFVMR